MTLMVTCSCSSISSSEGAISCYIRIVIEAHVRPMASIEMTTFEAALWLLRRVFSALVSLATYLNVLNEEAVNEDVLIVFNEELLLLLVHMVAFRRYWIIF